MFKSTEDKDIIELSSTELFQTMKRIQYKLEKIENLADAALQKASLSHSLIIVRKIGENKVDDLKALLD
jgi:ribosomal 50S subunit-associated protein YjgA (DUF615 family)